MLIELPIFVRNMNACIMGCKMHDGGFPIRLCAFNRRTLKENCEENNCPHPEGSQFLKLPPPAFAPAGANHAPSDFWSVAGPLLWKELHRWALSAHLINDNPAWLKNFTAKIACGDCKEHWLRWTAANPPDFSSHEKLFEWTCAAHNSVNARLNKPILPLATALRLWSAPALKPVIVTKGCGGCGK